MLNPVQPQNLNCPLKRVKSIGESPHLRRVLVAGVRATMSVASRWSVPMHKLQILVDTLPEQPFCVSSFALRSGKPS